MDPNRTCPQCGTPLSGAGDSELCPKCVAKTLLGLKVQYFGDYELLEEIGRGGMGVVYRARQVSLNRPVALKMLLQGGFASPEFVRRFQFEAEAAASLQHPNIVAIYEVGTHDGLHYFSMDCVDGPSLAEVAREGPLPPERAARYVQLVAEAVHHAHQRGILHRDLKPSNVLIDPFDQPRVTDFGLAKRLDDDLGPTLTGQVLGSPGYMSPEQAAGRHSLIGVPSDIHALGAILYFLLTGQPPFTGETPAQVLTQVQNEEPKPPHKLNPAVLRGLEAICLKCLRKEPQQRYASAAELAEDLKRWLEGATLSVHQPGFCRTLLRGSRKHPWVAVGGVAASAALCYTLVSLWPHSSGREANRESDSTRTKTSGSIAPALSQTGERQPAFPTTAAQMLFQDNFKGVLKTDWTITHPAPNFYTITPSGLALRAHNGWDPNNFRNLFSISNPAAGDFRVTLRLSRFVPASVNYAQLQLTAFDDIDDRVHCAYVSHKNQRAIELWAQNHAPRICHLITPIDFDTSPFSLRLEKRGAVYTALWSTNGVDFQRLEPPAQHHGGRPARLGFVAAYDPTASSVALIDSFSVEALASSTQTGDDTPNPVR